MKQEERYPSLTFQYAIMLKRTVVHFCTGDMNLRKVAVKENISVHGILFVFDELVRHALLPPELAADILKALKIINARLPFDEVDSRLKKWEVPNNIEMR